MKFTKERVRKSFQKKAQIIISKTLNILKIDAYVSEKFTVNIKENYIYA